MGKVLPRPHGEHVREPGRKQIWDSQARGFGNRGLRSLLPSWLDSDLVVQAGEERSTCPWPCLLVPGTSGHPAPSQNFPAPVQGPMFLIFASCSVF